MSLPALQMVLYGNLAFGQLAHIRQMLASDMILLEHDTHMCIQSGVQNVTALTSAIVPILPNAHSLQDLQAMFTEGSSRLASVSNHRVMEDGVVHAATLSLLGETLFTRFTLAGETVILQKNALSTLTGSSEDFPAWDFVRRILNLLYGNGSTVGRLSQRAE